MVSHSNYYIFPLFNQKSAEIVMRVFSELLVIACGTPFVPGDWKLFLLLLA